MYKCWWNKPTELDKSEKIIQNENAYLKDGEVIDNLDNTAEGFEEV